MVFAEFITQPSAFNASLGQRVQFNCSISQPGDLFWLINGAEPHEVSNRNREITTNTVGRINSSLFILALSINHNVEIICEAEIDGVSMHTAAVTLKVQGEYSYTKSYYGKFSRHVIIIYYMYIYMIVCWFSCISTTIIIMHKACI